MSEETEIFELILDYDKYKKLQEEIRENTKKQIIHKIKVNYLNYRKEILDELGRNTFRLEHEIKLLEDIIKEIEVF